MEEHEYIIILYDYYGELFNANQRSVFEDYYFNNLSLAEIAENEQKSRNAIHKSVKSTVSRLYEYENILGMYKRDLKLKHVIDEVTDQKIKKELEGLL